MKSVNLDQTKFALVSLLYDLFNDEDNKDVYDACTELLLAMDKFEKVVQNHYLCGAGDCRYERELELGIIGESDKPKCSECSDAIYMSPKDWQEMNDHYDKVRVENGL